MRKDVKLGFAIGGVLLAVLIVYVLVISGGDKPAEVTLSTPDSQQSPADAPVTPPASPTTKPAELIAAEPKANTDPFVATIESRPVADPAKPSGDDKWSAALNTGRLPVMMTQTPEPPAPTPAAVPAEANRPTPAASALSTSLPVAASNAPASVSADADFHLPMPSPATQPAAARTHTVQLNETFVSIAEAAYGNKAYYPHLIRANPTIDPRKLRPGMVINVPPASEVRADGSAAAPSSDLSTSAARIDEKTEYKVQAGDSLYKISTKLYGKADRADKIYDLNKSAIGSNPAHLKLGMVLKLPEAPTTK